MASLSSSPDPLLPSPYPSPLLPDPPPQNVPFLDPDPHTPLVSLPPFPSPLVPLPPLDFPPPPLASAVVDDLVLTPPPHLSTPTMHPNLVSTLKSIISPSSSPASHRLPQPQQSEDHPPQSSLSQSHGSFCSAPAASHLVDGPSSAFGLQELQALYSASFRQPDDQSQAAVVPVDVIQNRRPFQCTFPGCNKTFKNPQTLKMHHKTHYSEDSGYRKGLHSLATFPPSCKAGHNKKIPSKCPVCKRTFVGLYELRRHFGRKHSEGEKSHGCKKCGKKFYIEVDLRDHEKLCGEPLECKCGMKFAFKCNLVAHKKTHPDCQDSSDEVGGRGSGAAAGHGSSACKIPSRDAAALQTSATVSSSVYPSNQPSSTCALAANFLNPTSMAHVALRKPFTTETVNLAFRPDVKSEDVSFPWFPSAILGVGPMV